MLKAWAAGVLGVAVLVAGCSSGGSKPAGGTTQSSPSPAAATSSAPPYLSVFGDVSIVGPYSISATGAEGKKCQGLGLFADVHEGTNITLADGTGTLVGATHLTDSIMLSSDSPATRKCEFSFTFDSAVVSGQVFTIEIPGHGKQSFQRSDAESSIHLTLGAQ